jgi:hypothetical protein
MTSPRASDDFAAIRARMKELQRERAAAPSGKKGPPGDRRPDPK